MHGYGFNRLTVQAYDNVWGDGKELMASATKLASTIKAPREHRPHMTTDSLRAQTHTGWLPPGGTWPSEIADAERTQRTKQWEATRAAEWQVLAQQPVSPKGYQSGPSESESDISSHVSGLSDSSVTRVKRLETKLEQERRRCRELELTLERARQPSFMKLFGAGETGPWVSSII